MVLVPGELAAHPGLEEPQAAVIGRQAVDVLVDLLAVHGAAEEPEDAGLRLDLRAEPGVAGDGVADELGPQVPLLRAFVDQVDRAAVARLAPLDQRDLDLAEPLGTVVLLDLAAAFLDGVRVHGVARLQPGLLGQLLPLDLLVAHVLDRLEHRALVDFEDHHAAAGDLLGRGLHVGEHPRAVQAADVFFDHLRLVRPLGPRVDVANDLLDRDPTVPADPQLDHLLLLLGSGLAVALAEHEGPAENDGHAEQREPGVPGQGRFVSHFGHSGPFGARRRGARQDDREALGSRRNT